MANLTDKEIMSSILNEHKLSASSLTNLVLESACPMLRSDAESILTKTFNGQKQVFDIMSQKGWYPVQNANQQEISMAQQKVKNIQSQM
ncbi:coat F domain-containing protein [Ruminiclostridium sufflavum DSM 19573]|uniref:Coat F domain-containing protein n=1 Tax=Ruminiclostridium sufflavum DSM 19573 TaxID=1121337 RepID=A0A318XQQ2_9FIRM|nr:spore coat protein [Ruminiclostridium sufflavum]PYG89788.1 coat F domain-containing protein [Ruminiclostridium sufflavum DSM 19573]